MFVFIVGALLMLIFSLFGAFMFPLYAPRLFYSYLYNYNYYLLFIIYDY
jgi:hypothetical protein